MAKKQKYYVVWEGQNPGIYDNWEDCLLQTKGYPGAKYKSFTSQKEAEEAFYQGPQLQKRSPSKRPRHQLHPPSDLDPLALSVDAACSGNPGDMEYRGVWVSTGEEYFRKGPFHQGTNNIGEFLALVHAAALLKKSGITSTPIYTDSRTAMAWIRKKKANTKLKFDHRNRKLKELIGRAEAWLQKNTISNPIKKWETKNWGEIPADFGRK
jgi:ribonuclease HI